MSKKHPFLIFLSAILILSFSVIAFIQSQSFARILKRVAAQYIPKDLGIQGDFTDLSVRMFPPGISLKNAKVILAQKNALDLPADSHIQAERIDLGFLPVQMLSGNIRIHKVTIYKGDVQLNLNPIVQKKTKQAKFKLDWDELIHIRTDAIALEETHVSLNIPQDEISLQVLAKEVQISRNGAWSKRKKAQYKIQVDLSDIKTELPTKWKVPKDISSIVMTADFAKEGLKIETLSIQRPGFDLKGKGILKGDLLDPKGLVTEGEVAFTSDLSPLLEYAFEKKQGALPQGLLSFQGKVHGEIDRPNSIRADGNLQLRDFRYKEYVADSLDANGAWSGKDLTIKKLVISSKHQERKGSSQPGSGGKIEAGPFKVNLDSREAVSVPVTLTQAHIHWLAAPVLSAVYPLDLRLTGSTQAVFKPAASKKDDWNLKANLDWKVEKFQLDNQKLGQVKPQHKILEIPFFTLRGGFSVNSQMLKPEQLVASVNKTKLELNGKIDFKQGFDFTGVGPVDLAEVGKIAEKEIRGEGTLKAHVHGPTSKIVLDFDTDLKNAYYLRLKLGTVKGRITWDDDPNYLRFTRMELNRANGSLYKVNGLINFNGNSTIGLDVDVPRGTAEDLIEIFSELTEDLWWYPRTMTGDLSGKIQITGGLGLDELSAAAQLAGPNWDYMGETFRSVSLKGGYDKGKYYLESLKATKRSGTLSGRISFDKDKKFDWEFGTENFTLSDFDPIARLDVPVRGRLHLYSKGKGPQGSVESESTAVLKDVAIRGLPAPASELNIKTKGSLLEVLGSAFGGQGTLKAAYDFNPAGKSFIFGELKNFDFSPVLLLLNPKTLHDKELAGLVSGAVDLSFKSGEFEKSSGSITLKDYVLAKSGSRFTLLKPVNFRVDQGTFRVSELTLQGNLGQTKLDLRSNQGNLNGKIYGEMDISIFEFFTSAIGNAEGTLALNFDIGGILKAPLISGNGILGGAVLRVPAVEAPFENIMGSIHLNQNVLSFRNIEADLATGRVNAGGKILFFADRYPTLELDGTVDGSKLKIYPLQVAKVRGKLNVRGSTLPYLVGGNIQIESAVSREKILQQQAGGGSLKSARYTPPLNSRSEGSRTLFKLNIDVNAPGNIIVQNELFDGEAKGRLTVVNTLEAPRILGTVEVIQGKLIFKDRIFQVQSGMLEFDNPTTIVPRVQLMAVTELNNKKIQIYVSGRADKPKIELSSNPVMPEPEILSLLALGVTTSDAQKFRAADRSAYERGEAVSLVLHSLDFNRDVKNKTGFQIELDEAVDQQAVNSIFRPRSDADGATAPKIVIKRQIGKKIDLSVGSTVGVGTSNQRQVNAEVHVTPGFSVLGVWDYFEGANTQTDNRSTSYSYGIDLKVQKRFK